jgi:hypothetical protein
MRRRGMHGYSPEGQSLANAGKQMGALARDHHCRTQEEFERAVTQPPHPLLSLVAAVYHMRGSSRGVLRIGAPGETLLQALRRQPRTLRAQQLLEESWAFYRLVRLRACPRSEQPAVEPADVPLPWTRAVARYLRPAGVRPPAQTYYAQVRADQARERLRELWDALADRSAVVWVDNYARQRYRRTPQDANVSLNVTVMAVARVPAPALGPFPGYPSLEQLHQRHLLLADEVAQHAALRLPAMLAAVVAHQQQQRCCG